MRTASIIIPTRARLNYLEVALASIAPQAAGAGAEVLVIDDAGPSLPARALAARFGARYEPHPAPLGLNAARNTGVERSSGELVVFVDDDIRASQGWLAALIDAAQEHPRVDVFTGPIRPRLEGSELRTCGREGPPITALDLGGTDTEARVCMGRQHGHSPKRPGACRPVRPLARAWRRRAGVAGSPVRRIGRRRHGRLAR